jgi:hypothetical protein
MIAQGCELKKAGMLTLEPQRILERYWGLDFTREIAIGA